MKKLRNITLLAFFSVSIAGCWPGGGMGKPTSLPKPGTTRGVEKNSGRLSVPKHIPVCYMDGRTLVMVYERENKYLEVPLDDIRFNNKPRKYNAFSYHDFKEIDGLDFENMTQITSLHEGVRYLKEEQRFEAGRYSKEKINRGEHTIYRYKSGHMPVETASKWVSFILTDPQGSDKVIYIRRKSY